MDVGAVLVTGASSGIGRAVVGRLLDRGHVTYATARRPEALDDLAARGAHVLALDVTDEDSMRSAVAEVERAQGSVGALVNNAGYGEYGPVETVDPERVRRQMETNLVGPLRLAQLVLPGMRAAGRGRIVNVSSMGGRMVLPGGGVYHASKHALEALSDALRVEVAPFGIKVTVVEPGLTRTAFGRTADATLDAPDPTADGPYADLERAVAAQMAAAYSGRGAVEPSVVAETVVAALEARRPRARYLITPTAKALVHTRRLGGDRLWDALVRRQLAAYQR